MLGNGQFKVNNYLFGCGQPVDVLEFSTGGVKYRTQDAANPLGDSTFFGRDFKDTDPIKMKVVAKGATPRDALDAMNRFTAAWESKRDTPGALTVMQFGILGFERRVYGRCRDAEFEETTVFSQPRVVGNVQFERADPLFYMNASQSVSLTLNAGDAGGIIFPLTFPWTSTIGGPRQGVVDVDGIKATPALVVKITGPVTNPKVSGPGWSVSFPNLTLKYDETVTVDTRQVSVTRNGASIAGSLSRYTFLDDVKLKPGPQEIVFEGIDNVGAATATVSWFPAMPGL